MFNSIEIDNFRGIVNAKIDGFKRINIFVGPNGSGKTSIFEAIFLASGGSPELLLRLKGWRGRDTNFESEAGNIDDVLWSDTFLDRERKSASITLSSGDLTFCRKLYIEKVLGEAVLNAQDSSSVSGARLRFTYRSDINGEQVADAHLATNGLNMQSVFSPINCRFLASRTQVSEKETARLYSELEIEGRSHLIENAISSEFDFIDKIRVLSPSGNPALFGKTKNGNFLPLTLISSGVNHLAGILVRLASLRQSVLIIDEIENGFYYDRLASIWSLIYDLAVENDSQVFISTHSQECLIAARQALEQSQNDVCLIRSRISAAGVQYKSISGSTAFASLTIGDIR